MVCLVALLSPLLVLWSSHPPDPPLSGFCSSEWVKRAEKHFDFGKQADRKVLNKLAVKLKPANAAEVDTPSPEALA